LLFQRNLSILELRKQIRESSFKTKQGSRGSSERIISDKRSIAYLIPILQKKATDDDAGTRRWGDAEIYL
jgi:hypothetical protein